MGAPRSTAAAAEDLGCGCGKKATLALALIQEGSGWTLIAQEAGCWTLIASLGENHKLDTCMRGGGPTYKILHSTLVDLLINLLVECKTCDLERVKKLANILSRVAASDNDMMDDTVHDEHIPFAECSTTETTCIINSNPQDDDQFEDDWPESPSGNGGGGGPSGNGGGGDPSGNGGGGGPNNNGGGGGPNDNGGGGGPNDPDGGGGGGGGGGNGAPLPAPPPDLVPAVCLGSTWRNKTSEFPMGKAAFSAVLARAARVSQQDTTEFTCTLYNMAAGIPDQPASGFKLNKEKLTLQPVGNGTAPAMKRMFNSIEASFTRASDGYCFTPRFSVVSLEFDPGSVTRFRLTLRFHPVPEAGYEWDAPALTFRLVREAGLEPVTIHVYVKGDDPDQVMEYLKEKKNRGLPLRFLEQA